MNSVITALIIRPFVSAHPLTDLHPVVRLGVDVNGSAEVVHGPAVRLVDRDLLLVRVAHSESATNAMQR